MQMIFWRIPMKKKLSLLLSLCLCILYVSTGCGTSTAEPVSKTGLYFDTVITLTLYGEDASYMDDCFALAQKYEDLFSRTKEGTDVWNINHNQGTPVAVSEETFSLIQTGISYCEASGGAFDITVGALSDVWDFTSEDAVLPSAQEIALAKETVDYHNILLDEENQTVMLTTPGTEIDLGGIAKGYIADRIKNYLLEQGVTSGLINLGGNVLCVGPKDSEDAYYTIAIQKPFSEDGEPIASLKLTDQSAVTSGTYQRYFTYDGVIYHHILDLSTGYPCQNGLTSVTIISDTSVDGDALSTTCFLMGLEDGMAYVESMENVEAIFITEDNELHCTSGIGHSISFTEY
jgi:thiamine biosynthesis lipoprotein